MRRRRAGCWGRGGEQVTEYSVAAGVSSWAHTNVFAGSKLDATYNGADTYFALSDWLGTKRVEVDASGACATGYRSLPFGDGLASAAVTVGGVAVAQCATDATEQHFTGKERDTESGNDYFEARYFASGMGRWLSPDWSAKEEPVPYAKLDDPQTLNLYGYVGNNPSDRTDPDGHACKSGDNQCELKEIAKNTPALHTPSAPPIAELKTDMKGGTTTLTVSTNEKTTDLTIHTQNKVDSSSKPGANAPYSTPGVVGVKTDAAHAGQPAYGPKGSFIDTGDPRGRAIHGGGSGLHDGSALGERQSRLMPTFGCTRGFNNDVIRLGKAITAFQQANPGTPIPYVRQ